LCHLLLPSLAAIEPSLGFGQVSPLLLFEHPSLNRVGVIAGRAPPLTDLPYKKYSLPPEPPPIFILKVKAHT
jgi:hypothetical protein